MNGQRDCWPRKQCKCSERVCRFLHDCLPVYSARALSTKNSNSLRWQDKQNHSLAVESTLDRGTQSAANLSFTLHLVFELLARALNQARAESGFLSAALRSGVPSLV